MSEIEQDSFNPVIKNLFQNENLTGFQIARNTEAANLIKRDSTDFALEVVKHERGRQIVCQLIDVALRPRLLINHLNSQNNHVTQNSSILLGQNSKSQIDQNCKQTTSIIYNAIEILTNQYEDFVKFIFEDKPGPLIDSKQFSGMEQPLQKQKSFDSKGSGAKQVKSKKSGLSMFPYVEDDAEDCVIMDGNFPELTKNQSDQLLRKINSSSKLDTSDIFQCQILERMFLLFEEPAPIEQTPVSYFNKIILQFVYQKPQQIMRFFYCQNAPLNKKKGQNCQKIRKIAYHLYNHSIIQLLVHIMQLQNDGNFFPQQKIEILREITEQVFHYQQSNKIKGLNGNSNGFDQETSTMSDFTQEKVNNYILFLKSLYEKLEDRYEQEKFLQIFKYHLNDQRLLQKIISYFLHHFNYFDTSGLSTLLIQILKMDQINFKLHKAATQASNPFGGNNNFSFNTKNEESSIASYDLKLSKDILDQIEKVLTTLSSKYEQWEGSTMRMIEYYELMHCWLNVTVKDRQFYAKNNLITSNFINECLFKIQSHEKSTILHNAIKNLLVDFLPRINDSIKIILAPQCQLIEFIENYLERSTQSDKKSKRKCYENQLYHIGKTVLSIWQQQKMLHVMKKTEDDEQDFLERRPSDEPNSPTGDAQNIIRFERLRSIINKKQQFYDHLICGDPRKMGEYQEEQSSQIIMTSSFKNFFKPSFNNGALQNNPIQEEKTSGKDRYGESEKEEVQNKPSLKGRREEEQLKVQTNFKTSFKFRNLKLGDDHANSLFESAISPLNANRSHTFNFDFDALPLDSDNQAVSEEQDLPVREGSGTANEDEIKLMQENIENLEIVAGNVLGVESNILFSSNSISNDRNFLNCDNYRRDELSKSIQINDMNMQAIQKVDSYLAIDSPRRKSEDDILSLGLDSNKESGSKFSDQNQGSQLEPVMTSNIASFIKEDSRHNPVKIQGNPSDEVDALDINFVTHYSSYLKYDLDKLFTEVQ